MPAPMTTEDRQKAVDAALKAINKKHGDGSVFKLGDDPKDLETTPTGIMSLDIALGVPGWPRGRIIEIYGPNGAGKTTLVWRAIAEAQKNGELCAFIDSENAASLTFAKALGVDVDSLYYSQPGSGEEALDIAEMLILSGAYSIVAIDSVATLVPQKELDGDFGDATMGLQARMMSQALRKLTPTVAKNNVVLFFTNQLRKKIGIVYGNPEVTAGGEALPFYASIRIDVRRGEYIKDGADVIGQRTKAKVVKNKVGRPYNVAEYDLLTVAPNMGVSVAGNVRDMALKYGIMKQSGSFIKFLDQTIQGREKVREYLEKNPEVMEDLRKRVWAAANDQPDLAAGLPGVGTGAEEGVQPIGVGE